MNQKGFINIILVVIVVALAGVVAYFLFVQKTPGTALLLPSTMSLQNLLAAPEKIVINGSEYVLETNLWRDFMPSSPPDGKPLIALIKVKTPETSTISPEINATRLWIVNNKEIWETEFSDEERPVAKDILEKVARNGPKWSPGITVDVVVRVIDSRSGGEYLLRASDQNIYRTD